MFHKSEMAGPFNRGDTIINKHFTFTFLEHLQSGILLLHCNVITLNQAKTERAVKRAFAHAK